MTEKVVWTAKIESRMTELLELEHGLTYEQIAQCLSAEFGMIFTKNSCIGRAHRMRMPPRPPKDVVLNLPRKVRTDAPIEPRWPKPRQSGLAIHALRDGVCRWPISDTMGRPPLRYCGKRTEFGAPYCSKHTEMAYHQPRKTWA